jgi:hypothetical protein
MPTLTKRERVEAIMRYIHSHKWQQNTADVLARDLNIPSATVRKTLNQDYPECFDRDPDDRRNIRLTLDWPDNRPFDLEPAPDRAGKLKAEYMNSTLKFSSVYQTRIIDALYGWAEEGLAMKKSPDTYYHLWNTLNLTVAMMQLVKSKDPRDKARRLFDDPEAIPLVMDFIADIERGLNK